MAPDSTANVMH